MSELWSLEAHEETSKKKNRLCWSFLYLASLVKIEYYVVSTGHRTAVVGGSELHFFTRWTTSSSLSPFIFFFLFFQVKRQNRKWRKEAGSRASRGTHWTVPHRARYQPSLSPQGPLFCGLLISRPKPAPNQALPSPGPRSSTFFAIPRHLHQDLGVIHDCC